jgi:hypothetical protein
LQFLEARQNKDNRQKQPSQRNGISPRVFHVLCPQLSVGASTPRLTLTVWNKSNNHKRDTAFTGATN